MDLRDLSRSGSAQDMLERHATPITEAKVLPFRIVTPTRGDHFRTCVPLTSLRAAAGRFSEEQAGFDDRGEWAEEWVTWDGAPKFEPGMFVAKVLGDSNGAGDPEWFLLLVPGAARRLTPRPKATRVALGN